ncbi:PRD domain-containing protein [Erysipelotrichaceae bacterium HCN-30851]
MLTEKKKILLNLLMKQQGIMTAEAYAKVLGVSKRSIYSYLEELKPYLLEKGYEISKIPSKGIEILSNNEKTTDDYLIEDDYSIMSRRYELLNRLLIHDEIIDMIDFGEEFYISESSIRKDISYLSKYLENFPEVNIIISKGKIYKQNCDEAVLINAIVYLNESICHEYSFEEKINYLRHIFNPKTVDFVVDVMQTYINSLNLRIAEHYISHICSVMITLVTRVSIGKHIVSNEKMLDYDKIKKMADILLARQFLESIGVQLKLNFQEGDIEFISNYLRADRIQISNFEKIKKEDLMVYRRIFNKLERIIDIEIDEQDESVQNLLLHLNAMVFRLRNGIVVNNNLTENIKKEFGVLFNLIWVILESENEYLQIKITEDEVGFLLIHFQNIIEKQKKTKKILLICPQGAVVSNLMLTQIRDLLPAYNFIEMISLDNISEVKLDSIDFIISTEEIKNIGKPLVKVSPVLTREDLVNIFNFYENLRFDQYDQFHDYKVLRNYLKDELIIESDVSSNAEVIDLMCKELVEQRYVGEDYKESVLHRESLGATDNVHNFAIPHGDIRFVNKTVISIVLLKNPLKWNKYYVNIVVFFNISKEDLVISKDILDDIFTLMHSNSFEKLIHEGLSKELFLKFIG